MRRGTKGILLAAIALTLSCAFAACGESSSSSPDAHHDSQVGSAQFIVPGADNTIQEYGAEATSSEFERIASLVHEFLDARAAQQWGAACHYLSHEATAFFREVAAQAKPGELSSRTCGGAFKKLTNPKDIPHLRKEAAAAQVASVRLKGDQAFAIYTGPEGAVTAMSIVKENGVWKIGSTTTTSLN